MTTNDRPLCDDSATVRPSPALVQAARVRVTIDDRKGVETDPEITLSHCPDPERGDRYTSDRRGFHGEMTRF